MEGVVEDQISELDELQDISAHDTDTEGTR